MSHKEVGIMYSPARDGHINLNADWLVLNSLSYSLLEVFIKENINQERFLIAKSSSMLLKL